MNFLENCVFVDEAGFIINMRNPNACSLKGTPAVIETPSTRAISHTILGAITALDVIYDILEIYAHVYEYIY